MIQYCLKTIYKKAKKVIRYVLKRYYKYKKLYILILVLKKLVFYKKGIINLEIGLV